jgi:hypothetical protein
MKCYGNIVGLGLKPDPTIYYSYSDAVIRYQMLKQVQHDIPFFRNVAGFETQKRRRHRNVQHIETAKPFKLAQPIILPLP